MLVIAPILKSETNIYLTLTYEGGLWGPHSRESLSHLLYRVLDHEGFYLMSAGGKVSCLVLPHEGVEDSHRILVPDK